MLIYVNLLCIKYHLIKSHGVTRQNLGWETHQNSPIQVDCKK